MTTERMLTDRESTAIRPLVADDVWVRQAQGPIPGSRQVLIVVTCSRCQETRRYHRRIGEGPSVGVGVGYVRHLNQLGWRAVLGTKDIICPKHTVEMEPARKPEIESEPPTEPIDSRPPRSADVPINRRLEHIGRSRIPVVMPKPYRPRKSRRHGPCLYARRSR